MNDASKFSLVKPTIDTPFHIDFEWWQQNDNNWRVFLLGQLCPTHQAVFADQAENVVIDFVDPVTAEVKKVDGLLHTLLTHCSKQGDFISSSSSMTSTVFRIFLANNNQPLTPAQISEMIARPAATILATLSGHTVYKGIRPILQ
jgi:hypothetical protein